MKLLVFISCLWLVFGQMVVSEPLTPRQAGAVSPDGTCGGTNRYKCTGSSYGNCCSQSGYCGSTSAYCGAGCQSTFGTCSSGSGQATTDGRCGSNGKTCQGWSYGTCCSASGYCGSSGSYCGQGCQATYSIGCQTSNIASNDGTCGPGVGLTCLGGPYDGQCCSASGYCGNTANYCGTGCQQNYGRCTPGSFGRFKA